VVSEEIFRNQPIRNKIACGSHLCFSEPIIKISVRLCETTEINVIEKLNIECMTSVPINVNVKIWLTSVEFSMTSSG